MRKPGAGRLRPGSAAGAGHRAREIPGVRGAARNRRWPAARWGGGWWWLPLLALALTSTWMAIGGQFQARGNLWVTLAVAAIGVGLAGLAAREVARRRQAFATESMFARACGHQPTRRPVLKLGLLIVALIAVGLALARPTGGQQEEEVRGQGLDLVVALDISQSMLVRDIGGYSRLEVAKALLERLVQGLKQDRIGLVVFAGETMVQCPLTHDFNSFLTFLERVDPVLLARQGTNLAAAVETALDRFDFSAGEQARAILLITDGEDQEPAGFAAAVEEARQRQVPLFTLAVGSREGGPIPVGHDPFGRPTFRRHQGQVVISRLDDRPLKEASQKTGGRHLRAMDARSAGEVARALAGLKRVAVKTGTRVITREWYQLPVIAAILLLMIESMISERIAYARERDHWLKRL